MLLLIGIPIAVAVAAIVLFVIYKICKMEKLGNEIDTEYPTTYATIEDVKEHDIGEHKCYQCTISFAYDYGREHRTVIELPFSVVPVPVGGKIKIKTNPDNMNEIILLERTYMESEEYRRAMLARGYVKTEYGYELK